MKNLLEWIWILRSLSCDRIRVHQNFMFSLVLLYVTTIGMVSSSLNNILNLKQKFDPETIVYLKCTMINQIFSLLCSIHQSAGSRSNCVVQESTMDMPNNEGFTHVLLPVSNILGQSFLRISTIRMFLYSLQMFVEGIYLHSRVSNNIFNHSPPFLIYYFIGWG